MKNVKLPSRFVVQIARLREVGRGGEPYFGARQILAVADTLAEARAVAARFPASPTIDVQILEVFAPIDVGGAALKFLEPAVRTAVGRKAAAKKLAARV